MLGDFEESKNDFVTVMDMEPDNINAQYGIGYCELRLHNF